MNFLTAKQVQVLKSIPAAVAAEGMGSTFAGFPVSTSGRAKQNRFQELLDLEIIEDFGFGSWGLTDFGRRVRLALLAG